MWKCGIKTERRKLKVADEYNDDYWYGVWKGIILSDENFDDDEEPCDYSDDEVEN